MSMKLYLKLVRDIKEQFPDKSLLINVKSSDPAEGELLAAYLSKLPTKQQNLLSKDTMKSCLLPYLSVGWTGYMPAACEHTQLHNPDKIAPRLWGWPDKPDGSS